MNWLTNTLPLVFTTFALGLSGCAKQAPSGGAATSPPSAASGGHSGHDHAAHGHPSHGPHHGELIELGNEEYHAELLHDETAGTVTIYVLDGAVKEQVPIEATEVTINATPHGQPKQFPLTASPDEHDPPGRSSRFVSQDADLAALLDEDGANLRLVLTINGKSYRGQITHNHDHDHVHH